MSGIFKDTNKKATRDTRSGILYPSRNKCYKALAQSLVMDPNYSPGWFDLCRKNAGRFYDVATSRKIGADGRLI
jgi:hypothetical protein